MRSRAGKLLALGPRGWRDLLRAQLALFRAQRRVDQQPIGSLAIRETATPAEVRGDPVRARALGLAVQRTASFGLFRPLCLVQSLALRELLRAEGIEGASIRIGVRRRAGAFEAHAWVLWGDEILGDLPEHVALFAEVDDLRILGRQ